ncbi:MAG: hypothetical protein WBV11_15655 [Salegentibacter sp.]
MKYAEFQLGSNKIEFLNSVFGFESILLNGRIVSRKFSFSGARHKIKLDSIDYFLETRFKQLDKRQIEIDLKDDENILESKVLSVDKKQRMYWMIMVMVAVFASYKLLNLLIENLN